MTIAARSRFVVLAFALAAPVGAAAANGCGDAKTQFDLDRCAGAQFGKADAALNLGYKAVLARLKDDDTRKALVGAQKAWLAFRDAECAFESSGTRGGSIQPMIVTQCRTRLTEARTSDLRAFLSCEEGDMGCPVPPR